MSHNTAEKLNSSFTTKTDKMYNKLKPKALVQSPSTTKSKIMDDSLITKEAKDFSSKIKNSKASHSTIKPNANNYKTKDNVANQ